MHPVLEIIRPGNVMMAMAGVAIGAGLAWQGSFLALGLCMIAAGSAVAGANTLNDVLDVRIDARAHPDRPLPSGRLTVDRAKRIAALGLSTGPFLTSFLHWHTMVVTLAGVTLALWYEARLKARPLVGNVVVAVLVGVTLVLGAIGQGRVTPLALTGAGLAVVANLGREVWKDLEDAEHDEDRDTLARLHPRAATGLARAASVATAGLALAPWWLGLPWPSLLGLVPGGVLALGASPGPPPRAQRLLKLGMLLALLGLAAGAIMAVTGGA